MYKVFLSHLHAEADLADVFRNHLQRDGLVEVFQSSRPDHGVIVNQSVGDAIENRVRSSDLVVLLYTGPDSERPPRENSNLVSEYAYARSAKREVEILTRLDVSLPKSFGDAVPPYRLSRRSDIERFCHAFVQRLGSPAVRRPDPGNLASLLHRDITHVLDLWEQKGYDPPLIPDPPRSRIPLPAILTVAAVAVAVAFLGGRCTSPSPTPPRAERISLKGDVENLGAEIPIAPSAGLVELEAGKTIRFRNAATSDWSIDQLLGIRAFMTSGVPILIDMGSDIGTRIEIILGRSLECDLASAIKYLREKPAIKENSKDAIPVFLEIERLDDEQKVALLVVINEIKDLEGRGYAVFMKRGRSGNDIKPIFKEIMSRVVPAITNGTYKSFSTDLETKLIAGRYVEFSYDSASWSARERVWSFVLASNLLYGNALSRCAYTHGVEGVRFAGFFDTASKGEPGVGVFPLPKNPGALVCGVYRKVDEKLKLIEHKPFWNSGHTVGAPGNERRFLQFLMNDDLPGDNRGSCIVEYQYE